MRTEMEANRALETYADMVRRICFMHLKNDSDVEDIFQDVFLKYVLHDAPFASDAHERAWLIRVSINACKDLLKSFFRRRVTGLDEAHHHLVSDPGDREVLDAILRLPDPYRDVVYLHYIEGYTAKEIGDIVGRGENTIYTQLARARTRLKKQLGGEAGDL